MLNAQLPYALRRSFLLGLRCRVEGLGFTGLGVLGFWGFGVVGVVGLCCFGLLGFWGSGVLGFWGFGVLGFWGFGFWGFGVLGFGVLGFWVQVSRTCSTKQESTVMGLGCHLGDVLVGGPGKRFLKKSEVSFFTGDGFHG